MGCAFLCLTTAGRPTRGPVFCVGAGRTQCAGRSLRRAGMEGVWPLGSGDPQLLLPGAEAAGSPGGFWEVSLHLA